MGSMAAAPARAGKTVQRTRPRQDGGSESGSQAGWAPDSWTPFRRSPEARAALGLLAVSCPFPKAELSCSPLAGGYQRQIPGGESTAKHSPFFSGLLRARCAWRARWVPDPCAPGVSSPPGAPRVQERRAPSTFGAGGQGVHREVGVFSSRSRGGGRQVAAL